MSVDVVTLMMPNRSSRATWDEYFLDIAHAVASRSTCSRRQVGAVIIKDRKIVATGYNGPPSGMAHCVDGGCPRAFKDVPAGSSYDNCVAVHAESNSLLQCAPQERDGGSLYCTDVPCFSCAKLIANSGVGEVVAERGVYDQWDDVRDFLQRANVRVRVIDRR